jgi:hypothetical protein
LKLDGKDLRDLPLVERKAQLEMLLKLSKIGLVHFVPAFDDGAALMLACMEQSLEGVGRRSVTRVPIRPWARVGEIENAVTWRQPIRTVGSGCRDASSVLLFDRRKDTRRW